MPDDNIPEMEKGCCIDTIKPLLIKLLSESERIIHGKNFTSEQAGEIALYITNMRCLLTELGRAETKLGRNEILTLTINDLTKRCLSLEGMAKEIRNDMITNKEGNNL